MMFARVYVCVLCVCRCVRVWMDGCMYMWMDVCAYVCMCIFTHSYVYIRIITYDKKGKEKTYVIYTHEALILSP